MRPPAEQERQLSESSWCLSNGVLFGLHKVVRLRQQENHCVRFTVTEREKSTSASTTKTALRLRNSDVDCCSAKDSGKCTLSTRHPEHGSCVSRPVAPKEERRPSSNAEDAEDLSPCPVYLKQCNVNANPVLMCSPQPEKHSSQEPGLREYLLWLNYTNSAVFCDFLLSQKLNKMWMTKSPQMWITFNKNKSTQWTWTKIFIWHVA